MTEFLLRFVHISDTHINPDLNYTTQYADYTPMVGVEALVEQLNALPFPIDFVLHTGDVAYDPVPETYEFIKTTLGRIKYPIHYLVGNHDHAATLQRVLMNKAEPQSYFYDEMDINGVQILTLDSNGPGTVPAGNVTPEQLAWLEDRCTAKDDRPLLIAIHHNVVPYGIPWLDTFMRTINGEAMHNIVLKAKHRLRGVFHGHIHQHIDVVRDGILYSSTASSWCQFTGYPTPDNTEITPDRTALPGFSVVTLTREQLYIRRHTYRVAT
jgi:3',5'-cyclic-AMP phosphodiesterase